MDPESSIPLVPQGAESDKPGGTDTGPKEHETKGVSLPAYDETTPLVDGAAPQNGTPEPQKDHGAPTVPDSAVQGSKHLPSPGAWTYNIPGDAAPTTPLPASALPYPTDQPPVPSQEQSSDLPYPPGPGVPTEVPSEPAENSSGGLPYPPESVHTDTPYPPSIGGDLPAVPEDESAVPAVNENEPKPDNQTAYTVDEARIRRIGRESFRESFRQVRGLLKLPSYRGGRNDFPAEPPPAYEDVNPAPLPETIGPRQPEASPEPSVIPPTEIIPRTFGGSPIYTTCPNCGERIRTVLSYEPGVLTYLFCCIFFMIGWWFMCCLLPFCIPGFKDVHHVCPQCKRTIGRYDRLGGGN